MKPQLFVPSQTMLTRAIRAVRGMGAGLAQAEDCVQTAYVKVCQKVDPSKGDGGSLLVAAAKRVYLDTVGSGEYRSARGGGDEEIMNIGDERPLPESATAAREDLRRLAAAVDLALGPGTWEYFLDLSDGPPLPAGAEAVRKSRMLQAVAAIARAMR